MARRETILSEQDQRDLRYAFYAGIKHARRESLTSTAERLQDLKARIMKDDDEEGDDDV